jgi:PKD repeat protein
MLSLSLILSSSFAQDKIHWGSTGSPLDGLTISWHSDTQGSKVKWGYTISCEKGEFTGDRRDDYAGYLYDYTFPKVNPADTIYYSIYTDKWSNVKTFETSAESSRFTFGAGGDSQNDNSAPWHSAASKVATEDLDLFIFTGDNVKYDDNTTDWDNWWSNGDTLLSRKLIYYTGGNHEYGSIYLNQFVMPGNEKWYTFEYGDVLFISLLTEAYQDSQYVWLQDVLKNTNKKWKVAFFHKPFFSSGIHGGDMTRYRDTWWKTLDDYGVDIILNGHDHFYLRTVPINCNVSNSEPVTEYGSNPGQGRLEIVTGSMGAELYKTRDKWFVGVNKETMNYVKFDVNNDTIQMYAYNISGDVIDKVTLSKKDIEFSADFITSTEECNLTANFINKYSNDTVSYLWDFGDDSTSTQEFPTHTYLEAGTYKVKLTIDNGQENKTVVKDIVINFSPIPTELSAVKNSDESVSLSANATGIVNWYDAPRFGSLLGTGNNITIPTTVKTTFYAENVVGNGVIYNGAKKDSVIGGKYSMDTVYGLQFSTNEDIVLKSIKIYNATSTDGHYVGKKTFVVKDFEGKPIIQRSVFIKEGEQRVILNLRIPAGNKYTLSVDSSANLWIDTTGVAYPYYVNDTINSIVTINSGVINDTITVDSLYYCFYDWEVETGTHMCLSDKASVSLNTAVNDENNSKIRIYPNPVKDYLNIDNIPIGEYQVNLYNSNMQYIKTINTNNNSEIRINFTEMSSGVYFCKILETSGKTVLTKKIVLIK